MKKHLLLILGLFVVVACHKKRTNLVLKLFVAPSHFPKPVYPIDSNVITAGFDLGKIYFTTESYRKIAPLLVGNVIDKPTFLPITCTI
jgi:hypothetical protein